MPSAVSLKQNPPRKGEYAMWNQFKACLKDEAGQGMTEYILIISLIALGTIVAFTLFRDNLRNKVELAADSLEQVQ